MHGLKCRDCGKVWTECRLHTCRQLEDHPAGICEECLPAREDGPAVKVATAPPIENVNGFLSGKAGFVWPGALVIEGPDRWLLRRPNVPDIGLGSDFKHARMALYAMIRATPKAQ